jgi:hypothetical protein
MYSRLSFAIPYANHDGRNRLRPYKLVVASLVIDALARLNGDLERVLMGRERTRPARIIQTRGGRAQLKKTPALRFSYAEVCAMIGPIEPYTTWDDKEIQAGLRRLRALPMTEAQTFSGAVQRRVVWRVIYPSFAAHRCLCAIQ